MPVLCIFATVPTEEARLGKVRGKKARAVLGESYEEHIRSSALGG